MLQDCWNLLSNILLCEGCLCQLTVFWGFLHNSHKVSVIICCCLLWLIGHVRLIAHHWLLFFISSLVFNVVLIFLTANAVFRGEMHGLNWVQPSQTSNCLNKSIKDIRITHLYVIFNKNYDHWVIFIHWSQICMFSIYGSV